MLPTRAYAPFVVLALVGCAHVDNVVLPPSAAKTESPAAALRERALTKLSPIRAAAPPADGLEATRFALGRKLFFEKRLGADGDVACASCHVTELGGGDGRAKSIGVNGKQNPRNAPSIFNVGLQPLQHWRADRESLEDQASRSPLGPASFGNADEPAAVARLKDAGYEPEFARAFPAEQPPITLAHFGAAVSAFERSLSTPARFDAFLSGDDGALDAREQRGLSAFLELGCASCHAGPGLGGEQLRKFGVVSPYAQATHAQNPDVGRLDVTKAENDRFVFKVPQLRNVADSAPYFHDGSVTELGQAVTIMALVQLGQQLNEAQNAELVAFLRALSGPAPAWFGAP
jgi:cytochrome c peroxidase